MNELKHYGVLGMKWGVRKDREAKGTRRTANTISDGGSGKGENSVTTSHKKRVKSSSSSNESESNLKKFGENNYTTKSVPTAPKASYGIFSSEVVYNQLKEGTLPASLLVTARTSKNSTTSSGDYNGASTSSDMTRYGLIMGGEGLLDYDVGIFFESEEDLNEFMQQLVEKYNEVVQKWMEENRDKVVTSDEEETSEMNKNEIKEVFNGMSEDEQEALYALVNMAIISSGGSGDPKEFVKKYLE